MSRGFLSHLRSGSVPAESVSVKSFASAGGFLILLSLLSAFSGVAVAFCYHPSDPFGSIYRMVEVRSYGWYFWGMHYICSQALVALLLWHTFYNVSFRIKERSDGLLWFYALLLFLLVQSEAATGYFLRGDDRSQLAMTVFLNLIGIRSLDHRLLYVLHTTVFPFFILLGLVTHLYRVASLRRKNAVEYVPSNRLFAFEVVFSVMSLVCLNVFLYLVDIGSLLVASSKGKRAVWFLEPVRKILASVSDVMVAFVIIALPFIFFLLFPWLARRAYRLSLLLLTVFFLAYLLLSL